MEEHQLLTALWRLTGLRQASGPGLPEPAMLREHQDLWAIAYAAFRLLKTEPQTHVITPSSLLPYIQPSVRGDKRLKAFNAAAAAQVERVRAILARTRGEIYVTRARNGQSFTMTPPLQ